MIMKLDYDILTKIKNGESIEVDEVALDGTLKLMKPLTREIGVKIYIGKERYADEFKLFSPGGYLIAQYGTSVSRDGNIDLTTFNKLAAAHIAKEVEYIDHLPSQFFSKDFCNYVLFFYRDELERQFKPTKNIFGVLCNKEVKRRMKEMKDRLARYEKIHERDAMSRQTKLRQEESEIDD